MVDWKTVNQTPTKHLDKFIKKTKDEQLKEKLKGFKSNVNGLYREALKRGIIKTLNSKSISSFACGKTPESSFITVDKNSHFPI